MLPGCCVSFVLFFLFTSFATCFVCYSYAFVIIGYLLFAVGIYQFTKRKMFTAGHMVLHFTAFVLLCGGSSLHHSQVSSLVLVHRWGGCVRVSPDAIFILASS